MEKIIHIILFGSPGVGKGTQAKILSTKLNVPHISTGDILREFALKQTSLGLKAKEIMNAGNLVPDEIMMEIIKETLSEERCKNGFILDGFPRTLTQAEALEKLFSEMNINNINVINIVASDEEIVNRLTNRRACISCNTIFNYDDIKGKENCPVCNVSNSFYQRRDDDEQVIRRRLEVFRTQTFPILDYYNSKRKIITLNGLLSIDEVSANIIKELNLN